MLGFWLDVDNWKGTAIDSEYPKATPMTNIAKLIATKRVFAMFSSPVINLWF
jgi:hypothetical protein